MALALAVFWPATGYDFIGLDDYRYVVNNPPVTAGLSWAGVRWAFTTVYEDWWLPLLWISYMADTELFGTGPFGYHLTNILLHALNSALLFWVLGRLTRAPWPSAFVAALFAVHPLRVEAVAWITSRKDVLSGFFFLLSVLAYARSVERPTRARRGMVALGMLLGLFSKAILITLPPLLLLLDYWPLRRAGDPLDRREWKAWSRLLLEKWPLIVLAALFMAINVHTHTSGRGADAPLTVAMRLGLIPPNYWAYLGKFFWPAKLALQYPALDQVIWSRSLLALAGLMLVSVVVWRWRIRRPAWAVGWFWFLATLLPVIRGVRLGQAAMADRFMYLPAIGLLIMLAGGISDLLMVETGSGSLRVRPPDRSTGSWRARLCRAATLLAVLLVATCAAASRHYLWFWSNSESLFQRTLAVTENNYSVALNLATAMSRQGRLDDEIAALEYAIQSHPDSAAARAMLAIALQKKGRPELAEEQVRRVMSLGPSKDAAVYSALGFYAATAGRLPEAVTHFERALQLDDRDLETRTHLGITHLVLHQPATALACFDGVLRRAPLDDRAHFLKGRSLLDLGRPQEAVSCFEAALRLKPDKLEYQSTLAAALGKAGRATEALGLLRAARTAHPHSPELMNNLAWLLAARPAASGAEREEALQLGRQAVTLTGWGNPDMLDTLALALAANGRFEEAVATAEEALRKAGGQDDFARRLAPRLEAYRHNRPWTE